MGIKYYQLAKDEELPDEFCAVRDVGGEPSEYVFYVPEAENSKLSKSDADMWDVFRRGGPWVAHSEYMRVKAENAKLRELVKDMWHLMDGSGVTTGAWGRCVQILDRMHKLGIEVD